jgi:hypothetical protein
MRKTPTKAEDLLLGFRPEPGVLPGDAILTAADLEKLSEAPNEELQTQIEQARARAMVNAMPHRWEERGINAAQLLYARLIAGLIEPEEKQETERIILGLISVGGWPRYEQDIRLIRLTIRGCGFEPGRPLKFKDPRECASACLIGVLRNSLTSRLWPCGSALAPVDIQTVASQSCSRQS